MPDEPHWKAPFWIERHRGTFFSRVYPIWLNDRFVGAVVATASVRELSSWVREVGRDDPGTRFVLYVRARVLAHPLMAEGYPGLSLDNSLFRLAGFRNPVLAAIWRQESRTEMVVPLAQGMHGHGTRVGGGGPCLHVPPPARLRTGAADRRLLPYRGCRDRVSPNDRRPDRRQRRARAVGRCRRHPRPAHRRPIARISAAAGQVRDLDISEIDDLPASVFRELDRQSGSFNAMLRGLRWFEVYIPKKVVERLVKRGDIDDTMSSVRDITVMFTDIAGFSSVAENLSAPEVAALVNRHFAIVAGCI